MRFDFYSVPYGKSDPKEYLFTIDICETSQVVSLEDTIEKIFYTLEVSEFQIRFHDLIVIPEVCRDFRFKHLKMNSKGYLARKWQ